MTRTWAGTVQPRRREGDEAQAMLHSPPVRVRGLTLKEVHSNCNAKLCVFLRTDT